MGELPILFNTEMVRAILDDRKTCTRRVIKYDKADDVDKVVEQLEERKSLYQRLQKLQDRDCLQYGYKIETLNDAIEIVKAGRRMTNAERIRNMSDEELADFIVGLNLHCLAGFGKCDCRANKTCDNCNVEVKKWLQQKSEG
jgi:hypothetical protein